MVNKWSGLAAAWVGFVACQPAAPQLSGYAGVVEFEQELLAFERSGRLLTRPVERGAEVEAGALLGTLDDSVDRAALAAEVQSTAAAEAAVNLVKTAPKSEDVAALARKVDAARAVESRLFQNSDRDQKLAAKGVIPPAAATDSLAELERARAERQSLEAQLASLRRGARKEEVKAQEARVDVARANLEVQDQRLKKNELRALGPGVVSDIYADPGEFVALGTPVLSVVHRDHPLVNVFVPVGKLAGIKLGRKAKARVDAYSKAFLGAVEYISPQSEFTPRYIFSDRERPRLVVRVRVRLDDPDRDLVEGVPAFVEFE
jgi:HlyD family secretion protein